MYQNEILQAACDCQLPLEDHQLCLTTFKAGCVNRGISTRITKLH